MSTTTSADQFVTVSQSGSGATWQDTSQIDDGSSGEAFVEFDVLSGGNIKELQFIQPGFISSIDSGSEFEWLKVTLQIKNGSSLTGRLKSVSQTGGGISLTTGLSYTSNTLEGDASYWGISGSASEIFNQLKDGSMWFAVDGTVGGSPIYIRNIFATLTYTLPDTKRASLQMRCL